MNSEEEFYDAETGEKHSLHMRPLKVLDECLTIIIIIITLLLHHQGWSQMIPVRSALKMPWCLTVSR